MDSILLNFAPVSAAAAAAGRGGGKAAGPLSGSQKPKLGFKQRKAALIERRKTAEKHGVSLRPTPNVVKKPDTAAEQAKTTAGTDRKRKRDDKEDEEEENAAEQMEVKKNDAAADKTNTLKPAQTATKRAQLISSLWSSTQYKIDDIAAPLKVKTRLTPSNAAKDIHTFEETGLDAMLAEHLKAKFDIKHPTATQKFALPHLLTMAKEGDKEREIIIQAQTGSGKTLAFLLPLLQHLISLGKAHLESAGEINREAIPPVAMILAPTRELAKQIHAVLEKLLTVHYGPRWIVPCCLVGGDKRHSEKNRIRKGVTILVSTPGRLLDHMQNTEALKVDAVRWLIIDEADRFTELGFGHTMKQIMDLLDAGRTAHTSYLTDFPRMRQTILCSATIEKGMQALGGRTFENLHLLAADGDIKHEAPAQLDQRFLCIPIKLRLIALLAVFESAVRRNDKAKVLVFFSTCDVTDFYHNLFSTIKALPQFEFLPFMTKLHGELDQQTRTQHFASFNAASSGILFATSVAARGLDTPNVSHIIQFDIPSDVNEYIHRIGRTARAGKQGESLLILNHEERGFLPFVPELKAKIAEIPLDTLAHAAGWGNNKMQWMDHATSLQMAFENHLLKNTNVHFLFIWNSKRRNLGC